MSDIYTQPPAGNPDSTDLADALRTALTEHGINPDDLTEKPHQIADLLYKLNNNTHRELLCQYISLRAGRPAHDWPAWLNQLHDDVLNADAIDSVRKELADSLELISRETSHAQSLRDQLKGKHGSEFWDIEHAEGGHHFETTLEKLSYYAAAASALNPTRPGR